MEWILIFLGFLGIGLLGGIYTGIQKVDASLTALLAEQKASRQLLEDFLSRGKNDQTS